MRKAASRVTRRRGTGIPRNAIDPESPKGTHRTIAIIATGGTFLCSHAIVPKAPRYFKTLEDFIAGSKLQEYFEQLGLYKRDDKYFLPDGTEVVYKSTDPSIDSTNATYKERHSGATLIRELQNVHPEVDVLFIHGTDTAPQTAQFFDLQFGREAGIGIAVVTSQDPADAPNTDAHGQFGTAFQALHEKVFPHVFVPSNGGSEIYSGIIAKSSDASSRIYTGNLIATCDRGVITPLAPPPPLDRNRIPERVKIPKVGAFAKAIIKDFTPQADGEQEIQAENTADEISFNQTGPAERRYNAIVLRTAGSGNFPDYADPILRAANNEIPLFAVSEVPGAETLDSNGVAKYAASVVEKARELQLNNLIVLPATRRGPDMRPSSILALAATYAEPRTPEFLLFCHLFAAFAWTPEDANPNAAHVRGSRKDLIDARQCLDEVYSDLSDRRCSHTPDTRDTRAAEALGNARMMQIYPDSTITRKRA